mmetsp:Transcript_58371/g.114798  ORF Transcript_58371/g.114798 Transcript_58371/m.114798 type:complete len:321 (+) Transcript_58371:78-1040(+)
MRVLTVSLAVLLFHGVYGVYNVVHWMHIQKTSSWFGNFLLLWGCSFLRKKQLEVGDQFQLQYSTAVGLLPTFKCESRIYQSDNNKYGFHIPYQAHLNRSTVSLFRNPRDRIVSSFSCGIGNQNIMIPAGFPQQGKMKQVIRKLIKSTEFPIVTYFNVSGISACQTKMVLGRECGTVDPLAPTDLTEALRRLRYDFAFVGLTEESEASARLFLAMYPIRAVLPYDPRSGDVIDSPVTTMLLKQVKSSFATAAANTVEAGARNQTDESSKSAQLKRVLQEHGCKDPYDDALYAEALHIFYERCQEFGVKTVHSKDHWLHLNA